MASGRAADREDPKNSKRSAARSLDRDPISELPSGPAVRCTAPKGRTYDCTRPFCQKPLKILRRRGPFSNRSTPVKAAVYVARPGHGSLRGQRGLPQHLVRSGEQALQGPQRAYVDHAPTGPPRNCLHPRPGAMRVGVSDEVDALRCHGRLGPAEWLARSPDTVQDDRQLACQGYAGFA